MSSTSKKTKSTGKKTATGATILKSSIELNDLTFEINGKDHPFPPQKEASEEKPYAKQVLKIKKLRIQMETTDLAHIACTEMIFNIISKAGLI